jgi:exodeoxyribonuclease-1
MTRALRPEGIQWPFSKEGKPANQLELITSINNIEHSNAHNAMSDVAATIEVAKLIYEKQPKLFSFLLEMRDKTKIKQLALSNQPFVYTSGTYLTEFEKTTVVVALSENEGGSGAIVYDLRYEPESWLEEVATSGSEKKPLKVMRYNHCPAIAPLSVLDEASWQRIGLDKQSVLNHYKQVIAMKETLLANYSVNEHNPIKLDVDLTIDSVDERLYDGFMPQNDKKTCTRIRDMSTEELLEYEPVFEDPRLPGLYFLYKARQVPKSQLADDRLKWEQYLEHHLLDGGDQSRYEQFMKRLQELAKQEYLDADKRYILEELALYAQSVVPLQSY